MEMKWSVLAALRAGREQVRLGTSDGAIGAIRSLRGEVPAPVRDQAYYALMDTATSNRASVSSLCPARVAIEGGSPVRVAVSMRA